MELVKGRRSHREYLELTPACHPASTLGPHNPAIEAAYRLNQRSRLPEVLYRAWDVCSAISHPKLRVSVTTREATINSLSTMSTRSHSRLKTCEKTSVEGLLAPLTVLNTEPRHRE
jgi:hypothetical protein